VTAWSARVSYMCFDSPSASFSDDDTAPSVCDVKASSAVQLSRGVGFDADVFVVLFLSAGCSGGSCGCLMRDTLHRFSDLPQVSRN
jgi:hypothetical protein